MAVFLLIIGLVLFVGLVLIHEWGHFIVARRNGVDVEEFGLGFPPRAFGRKTKGDKPFILSVNWLPLGGFVRLKGEHDADTGKGTFGAASLGVKTKIMVAGVVMNLAVALVLFTILAWVGMPKLIPNQYTVKSDTTVTRNDVLAGDVQKGSPAAMMGLQARDHLVAIAPVNQPGKAQQVTSSDDLPNITKDFAGQKVVVTYTRAGQTQNGTTTLLTKKVVQDSKNTSNPKGYLGISPADYSLQRSTWSAPIVALGLTKQITLLTFQGLGSALKGLGSAVAGIVTGNSAERKQGQTQASSQVSGPVGIFVILKDGSALGPQLMLMIVAIISLTLAIMNILPIPALDGGKIFVTLIARLFHKKVSRNVEDWVYGTSFAFLLGLIVLITIVDVKRFF
ncbi:MAG TPA: M50 family metallopeptidase [Candidatus Saccharimonadales bacterium]|nr:M50 family metallopeptidase [Candidatus Saccharimonadales bacterium]